MLKITAALVGVLIIASSCGDKKEKVTAEDLPYIISDVINSENFKNKVIIESYLLNHKKGHKPSAEIELKINPM